MTFFFLYLGNIPHAYTIDSTTVGERTFSLQEKKNIVT